MKTTKITTTMLLVTLNILVTIKLFSQGDLNFYLSKMNEDSSKKYTQILTNTISSDLNSGMFQITKPTNKFSLYVGAKAIGSFLGQEEHFPGTLKDIPIVPLAVLQIGLGSVIGTDAFFRYLPSVNLGGYASVNAWGVGIMHNIGKDYKKMPFDITFQLSTHHLGINDAKGNEIMNMKSWAASMMVSKRLGILTLYGAMQYEKTQNNINYTINEPITKSINYSQENQSTVRAFIGFNLKMGPVNFNCDYNFGKNDAVTAGLGFGF